MQQLHFEPLRIKYWHRSIETVERSVKTDTRNSILSHNEVAVKVLRCVAIISLTFYDLFRCHLSYRKPPCYLFSFGILTSKTPHRITFLNGLDFQEEDWLQTSESEQLVRQNFLLVSKHFELSMFELIFENTVSYLEILNSSNGWIAKVKTFNDKFLTAL